MIPYLHLGCDCGADLVQILLPNGNKLDDAGAKRLGNILGVQSYHVIATTVQSSAACPDCGQEIELPPAAFFAQVGLPMFLQHPVQPATSF